MARFLSLDAFHGKEGLRFFRSLFFGHIQPPPKNKKPLKRLLQGLFVYEKILLDLNDVLSLEAFVAAGDIELDAVALVQ